MGASLNRIKRLEKNSATTIKPTQERYLEVAGALEAFVNEYNSPENVAKREEEYLEAQKIGALRKAAFERGEAMDKYPLPWERRRFTWDDLTATDEN